jgi:hypothetical protein
MALPLATAASTIDSCSCRGGKRRILGLRYSAKDLVVTPAMAWVARAESAATAPQLARCLRALDAAVQVPSCLVPVDMIVGIQGSRRHTSRTTCRLWRRVVAD